MHKCCNQGFNSTITAAVEAPRRDQIKESKLGLHPGMKDSLKTLCSDPNTDVVILSGSRLDVLEEVSPLPHAFHWVVLQALGDLCRCNCTCLFGVLSNNLIYFCLRRFPSPIIRLCFVGLWRIWNLARS